MSAALLVAAVQKRGDSEEEPSPGKTLMGITGQRQAIKFEVDHEGRPRMFSARIWSQCPGVREQQTDWTPSDGAPVRFRWRDDWVFVREEKSFSYRNGVRGFARTGMSAHVRGARIDGFARAVWRFERDGREYTVCDSGWVPFAAGDRAESQLDRVARVRDPVTLYPEAPERGRPHSFGQLRFVLALDQVCTRTYWQMRKGIRRARNRGGDHWRVWRAYMRGHAAQLAALRRLGRPPEAQAVYGRWLASFDRRVELERRQLALIRRAELDEAASLAARIATLKARGNAAGIAFGLRPCVSNGPYGAPKS